jgi:apolipoprotein N-acyltransferase
MSSASSFSFPLRCLVAVLCGAAYAGAFPPLGWRWLILPAVFGLIYSLRGLHGSRARALGFLFGMTAFSLSLSWLWNLFGGMAIVLWIVLTAFPALFAHMQGLARHLTGWKFAVFTALNWAGWEFIRAEIFPLKFPWMTVGLAVGPNALLPWIGVYGVGMLVVLFLATPWRVRSLCIAVAAAVLLYGAAWLGRPNLEENRDLHIAAIQLENTTMDKFIEATRALPPEIRYVVWPEYALPYDVRQNEEEWGQLLDLCKERNITLTVGTQSRERYSDVWRNIALTLDASGALGEHNKIHTVHMFADGTPGTEAKAVTTAHGRVGTPICFDCDYEGVIRKMTASGAQFIAAPVMDAISWGRSQHDQHAELFRIRAAENHRWVFSSATSGLSQAIDPNGKVYARLGAMEQGTMISAIGKSDYLTPYSRFGWLTPWVVLSLAGICWLGLVAWAVRGKLASKNVIAGA